MRLARPLDGRVEARLELGRNLVAPLLRLLLHLIRERIEPILGVDFLTLPLVLRCVLLRILDHAIDLGVTQPARRLDADLLFLARGLVLGGHVEDAVRVDVERDFDLRHAARSGRNARELELADGLVVHREIALALQHVNLDGRLVVVGRGERF